MAIIHIFKRFSVSFGKNSASTILSTILTVIFIVLLLTVSRIPYHRPIFLFFFVYLVLLPGYLMSIRLVPWVTGIYRLLISFILGMTCTYIILFILSLLSLDTILLGYILPVIVLILAFTKKRFATGTLREFNHMNEEVFQTHPWITLLIFILIVLTSVIILTNGDPLLYSSDSMDHMAYIRTISRSHEVFPENFYYRNGGKLTFDIRKGMYHSFWGAINGLTAEYDVHDIWPLISVIGIIFIILALFGTGKLLFHSSAIGLLSVTLFLIFYRGSMRGSPLTTINYPFPFGKIFFLMALSSLPLYVKTGKREFAIFIAGASLVAIWTHIAHLLVILFVIAIFYISRLVSMQRDEKIALTKKVLFLIALMIISNLPYLIFRYIRDYAPNNIIHTHVQGLLLFSNTFYIINPVVIFLVVGPLGLLSILSIFILWRSTRIDNNLKFLLHTVIAFYILVLNPLWVPFLFRRLSYLLLRFEFAAPSVIIAAYLMRELWLKPWRKRSTVSGAAAIFGWIFIFLILGYPILNMPSDISNLWRNGAPLQKKSSGLNLIDLYETVNRRIPSEHVIASDPITSYCIPAFTDQFVVCPYDQHSTPNDSTALTRIIDCRELYNPFASIEDIEEVLRKYNAEYLVINGRIPEDIQTMYWKPDLKGAEQVRARLIRSGDLFEVMYAGDALTLFKCQSGVPRESEAIAPITVPFVGDSVKIQEVYSAYESGESAVRIKSFIQDRKLVKRGDTLKIQIQWLALNPPPIKRYVVYIRFDTEFKKGFLYRKSFGKVYRKLYEKISQRRYRFRIDHQPLNGIIPPDTWPVLREIKDTVDIVVPRDISPGTYSISVKLAERTQYPNYTLSEILTDTDFYSGVEVSRVIIE